jgi:methionyl-tRNA formyltransferase
MKIVFFGTPDFVIPVLATLIKQYDVVGVVTAPDTIQGRKKILTPSPVKRSAQEKSIRTILTPQQWNNETIEQLQQLSPDLCVVAAYGKIIPKAILDIPRFGAINIHPSLLPQYRGPSPIQTALLNGDPESGVTIIQMDEKMDHGPILAQKKIPLTPADTFASLHHSMFQEAADLLPEVIEGISSGTITPVPQDDTKATYCRMITKEDGYFDLQNPPSPETLDRMTRAYYPWPTAWTKWQMTNGTWHIVKFLPEEMIQLEGGKPMKIKELLNGHPEMSETMNRLLGKR